MAEESKSEIMRSAVITGLSSTHTPEEAATLFDSWQAELTNSAIAYGRDLALQGISTQIESADHAEGVITVNAAFTDVINHYVEGAQQHVTETGGLPR